MISISWFGLKNRMKTVRGRFLPWYLASMVLALSGLWTFEWMV
jgi:hypothetical protein